MEIIWQLKLVLWSWDLEWHSQSIQRPHLRLSAVGYVTAACAAPLGGGKALEEMAKDFTDF